MPQGLIWDVYVPGILGTFTPPDPPPSGDLPRRLVTGLVSRSVSRTTTEVVPLLTAGVGGGQVVETYWKDLQPSSGSALAESEILSLKADLDQAQSRGLGCLLRLFAGYYAPDWARALAGGPSPGGGMVWYTNDGATGTGPPAPSDSSWKRMTKPMPCWWNAGYASAYSQLCNKLASEPRLMNHPALCGITMSSSMTQYAEPMIKQFACRENREAALDAGYTQPLDEAAFNTGFVAHKNAFSPLKLATYCSYNDYQYIGSGGGNMTSAADTIRLMEKQVAVLGRMAVIENNSLAFPRKKYPSMYAKMGTMHSESPPIPLHFQTEVLSKLENAYSATLGNNIYKVAESGMDLGGSAIEMPGGWQGASAGKWPAFTVAQASALNRKGYNVAVGLDDFHVTAV